MSAPAAPPVTLALELRRGVVFADEAHRQETSSWLQLVLDPRAKGGLLAVLNNENLATEFTGPTESSQCQVFANDAATQASYLQCLAVLQQNGWKVQTSHAYSAASLSVTSTVIFVKDHDNIAETVRATVRRSIKLGQLEEHQQPQPVGTNSNSSNNSPTAPQSPLQRRESASKLDAKPPLRPEAPTPVAKESITIQPATPLPTETRGLRRIESAPSSPFLRQHVVKQAPTAPAPPPPPPPSTTAAAATATAATAASDEPKLHRRSESAPLQPPPPPAVASCSAQADNDDAERPSGRISVKLAAAALAGTIGKVAMAPNPYGAGGPFRLPPRRQSDAATGARNAVPDEESNATDRRSIDVHPAMRRPTLRTQRRSRSSGVLRVSLTSLNDVVTQPADLAEVDDNPPPPPPPELEVFDDMGPVEDVVPQIGVHNPMFDQSGRLLLSPKSGAADRRERENQFFARLKAHEEERKRQELEQLGEEELQQLKIEEDAKSQREVLKTAHFARLGRPLISRPGGKPLV